MTDTTTDRSVLDIVLDAIPGYRQTEAALARLDTHAVEPPPGESMGTLTAEVMAAALAGEPFPDNLGQRTIEAARMQPVIYQQARLNLQGRLETARRAGAHDAIAQLRELCDDLIAEARQLEPALAGARTEDEAEEKGPDAQAAWQRLSQLARRHGEIRSVQFQLVGEIHSSSIELGRYVAGAHGLIPANLVVIVAGWLSNYDEVYPDWREQRRYGARAAGVGGIGSPPWPHSAQSPERPDFGSPEALLWIVTGSGKPWLPTVPEMVTVYVAAADAEDQRKRDDDETRMNGRPLNSDERQRARKAAEGRQREAETQIDLHQRRALHRPPTYTD